VRPNNQEELPLSPSPRWPTPAYICEAFELYLGASLLVGFLFFCTVIILARPLWAAIFLAGVLVGVFGFKWARVVWRRLSRVMGMFPNHA
jgi:xanthosine utilization system XapX-like protein